MRKHGKPCADLTLHTLPKTPGVYLTSPDVFEPWSEYLDPSREYRRLAAAQGSRFLVTSKFPGRAYSWWDGISRSENWMRWVGRLTSAQSLGTAFEIQRRDDIDAILAAQELDFPTQWNLVILQAREDVPVENLSGWVNMFQIGSPSKLRSEPLNLDLVRRCMAMGVPVEVHWGGWVPEELLPEPSGRTRTFVELNLSGEPGSYRLRNGFVQTGPWPVPPVVDGQMLTVDWEKLHAPDSLV